MGESGSDERVLRVIIEESLLKVRRIYKASGVHTSVVVYTCIYSI